MPRSRTRNTESNYNSNYSNWVYNDDIENSDEQLREHSRNETNSINNMERTINSYENYLQNQRQNQRQNQTLNQTQYSIDNHNGSYNQYGCIYNEPCNQEMNSNYYGNSWGNESYVPLLDTSGYNMAFTPPSLSNEYEVVDIPPEAEVEVAEVAHAEAEVAEVAPAEAEVAEVAHAVVAHSEAEVSEEVNTLTPPSTPSSTDSMPELEERELIPGDYVYKNHDGKLVTKGYRDEEGNYIYYLQLKNILKYVTCGGGVSDSYLDELTNYVVSNVPTMETVKEEHRTIDGRMYLREMPAIKWHQYGIVAKYCLDWAVSNPEKLTL